MRFLFVVQGEGRGHLTQAISLGEMLRRHGHEVVEVLIGKCSNRELPASFVGKMPAEVKVFHSPAIDYGKNGKKGKILKTVVANTTPKKLAKWGKSISFLLKRIDKTKPDVIVNFYEMLMGAANFFHRIDVPVVSLGHQFLVGHPDFGHSVVSEHGQFALRLSNQICSYGSSLTLALSFYPLPEFRRDRLVVVPPLLRSELFGLTPSDENFILGYMLNAGYMEEVEEWHAGNPRQKLHFFWDRKNCKEVEKVDETLTLHRISDSEFLSYMSRCSGYITTAGFESICEAMYLGKPVMLIPAHLEQQINAADAHGIGAGIVAKSFDISRLVDFISEYDAETERFRAWVNSAEQRIVALLESVS